MINIKYNGFRNLLVNVDRVFGWIVFKILVFFVSKLFLIVLFRVLMTVFFVVLLRVVEIREGVVVVIVTILFCVFSSRFCCRVSFCCFSCCFSWVLSCVVLIDVVCWIVVVFELDFFWMVVFCFVNLKFMIRFYVFKYGS